MDISIVLQPLLQLWWLFAIAFIIFFFKQPFGKGLLGEVLINLTLKLGLDKNKYRLLKNVTLPTDDGTTQIDHIVVSQYGVFVIETKNMKGWIFGGEHQRTWTQSIYKHKTKFQNPLHQNYKHVKTIESVLGMGQDKIFPVVVFVGDSKFKTNMPDNVTSAGGLFKYIKSKTKKVLSQLEVHKAISTIESKRLQRTIKTHQEHTSHVKGIINNKKNNDFLCPSCGNTLVLRVAKQGTYAGNEFYGCKSYPRCRYTKNRL